VQSFNQFHTGVPLYTPRTPSLRAPQRVSIYDLTHGTLPFAPFPPLPSLSLPCPFPPLPFPPLPSSPGRTSFHRLLAKAKANRADKIQAERALEKKYVTKNDLKLDADTSKVGGCTRWLPATRGLEVAWMQP
jgi:hypothetical protein